MPDDLQTAERICIIFVKSDPAEHIILANSKGARRSANSLRLSVFFVKSDPAEHDNVWLLNMKIGSRV